MFRSLFFVCTALALASGAAGAQVTRPTPVSPMMVTPGETGGPYILGQVTSQESCKITTRLDGTVVIIGTGLRFHTVTVWSNGQWTDSFTPCMQTWNA